MQSASKDWETGLLKSFSQIRGAPVKGQKSNYGIPLNLQKRFPKIREDFVNDSQLNMM